MARAMRQYFFYSRNKAEQQVVFVSHLTWIVIPMIAAAVFAALFFVAIRPQLPL